MNKRLRKHAVLLNLVMQMQEMGLPTTTRYIYAVLYILEPVINHGYKISWYKNNAYSPDAEDGLTELFSAGVVKYVCTNVSLPLQVFVCKPDKIRGVLGDDPHWDIVQSILLKLKDLPYGVVECVPLMLKQIREGKDKLSAIYEFGKYKSVLAVPSAMADQVYDVAFNIEQAIKQ